MKYLPVHGRTLALVVVLLPLLALFVYVALRSGPLAPIARNGCGSRESLSPLLSLVLALSNPDAHIRLVRPLPGVSKD